MRATDVAPFYSDTDAGDYLAVWRVGKALAKPSTAEKHLEMRQLLSTSEKVPPQLVAELLGGSTRTLLASNLVALLIYSIVSPHVQTLVPLAWFIGFTLVNLSRLLWARLELVRFHQHPARSANLYAAGALLGGCSWAAVLGLLGPHIPSQSSLLVLFVLVCLPPAALPSNAIHSPTYLAFSLPIFVGLQWWTYFVSTELRVEFSLLALIYSALVILSGLRYGNSLRENILRNQENQNLLREVRGMNERLMQYAYRDPLTELSNRRRFDEQAARLLEQMRDSDRELALILIDIDDFKRVNDTLGHDAGDQLLRHIAERIGSVSRQSELLALEHLEAARLGGDEFVVLYQAPSENVDLAALARRLLESVSQPLLLEGHRYTPRVSIGAVQGAAHTPDIRSLMRDADKAMYQAKQEGGNRVMMHPPDRVANAG